MAAGTSWLIKKSEGGHKITLKQKNNADVKITLLQICSFMPEDDSSPWPTVAQLLQSGGDLEIIAEFNSRESRQAFIDLLNSHGLVGDNLHKPFTKGPSLWCALSSEKLATFFSVLHEFQGLASEALVQLRTDLDALAVKAPLLAEAPAGGAGQARADASAGAASPAPVAEAAPPAGGAGRAPAEATPPTKGIKLSRAGSDIEVLLAKKNQDGFIIPTLVIKSINAYENSPLLEAIRSAIDKAYSRTKSNRHIPTVSARIDFVGQEMRLQILGKQDGAGLNLFGEIFDILKSAGLIAKNKQKVMDYLTQKPDAAAGAAFFAPDQKAPDASAEVASPAPIQDRHAILDSLQGTLEFWRSIPVSEENFHNSIQWAYNSLPGISRVLMRIQNLSEEDKQDSEYCRKLFALLSTEREHSLRLLENAIKASTASGATELTSALQATKEHVSKEAGIAVNDDRIEWYSELQLDLLNKLRSFEENTARVVATPAAPISAVLSPEERLAAMQARYAALRSAGAPAPAQKAPDASADAANVVAAPTQEASLSTAPGRTYTEVAPPRRDAEPSLAGAFLSHTLANQAPNVVRGPAPRIVD